MEAQEFREAVLFEAQLLEDDEDDDEDDDWGFGDIDPYGDDSIDPYG